jgi:hypothetical protein
VKLFKVARGALKYAVPYLWGPASEVELTEEAADISAFTESSIEE